MSERINLNMRALQDGFSEVYRRVPRIAGAKSVSFFKQNFRRQGWPEGGQLRRWKPRKGNTDPGRATLVKSGRMWRSIRVMRESRQFVQVGTNDPKAEAHNEGADLSSMVSVPQHRRKGGRVKSHSRTVNGRRQRVRAQQRSATQVSSHRRRMNTKLPKRQFIGHSDDVIKSVEREIFRDIDQMMQKL